MYKWYCYSGNIIISDPSYKKSFDNTDIFTSVSLKAKKGEWKTTGEIGDILDWGERVKKIISTHISFADSEHTIINHKVSVDTGQLAILEDDFYPETKEECELFYERCSYLTDKYHYATLIDGEVNCGMVTNSGIGDGLYDISVYNNENGEAEKIVINFDSRDLPTMSYLESKE